MLTVAEDTLTARAARHGRAVKCFLYGQENNTETYVVRKADMLLKGEGESESADHNIIGCAEWSTLSHDASPPMSSISCCPTRPTARAGKKDLEFMA